MLHITATIHFFYKLQMFYKNQEAREAGGGARPEEEGAGTVEMLFLDIFGRRFGAAPSIHQSFDPPVPGQQSKASRGCPSLWKVGSTPP